MTPPPQPGLSFGPYAAGPPTARLLGAPLEALERSRLFVAGGVRMRRMVGRDRVYVGEHTDYVVGVDGRRAVVSLMATLTPPDRDVDDDCYGITARREGSGETFALPYCWAMLIQLGHEVLGLSPQHAEELLNQIYAPSYLPRTLGDVQLSLGAGRRFDAGDKALVLMVSLAGGDR